MNPRLKEKIEDDLTAIDEQKLYDLYDEMLDCEGTVKVGGLDFYPSRIIEELDPIAYRCGYSDWLDAQREQWTEFNGDYYDRRKFEDCVEELISGIESEIEDLEEQDEDPDADDTPLEERARAIAELQAEIVTIKKEVDL